MIKRLSLFLLSFFAFISVSLSQEATLYSSSAAEASAVVKNSGTRIYWLVGYNGSASDQYVQIHNTTSLPANGVVPTISFKVMAGKNFSLAIPREGIPLGTGLVVCNSSTSATKTIGSADCLFYVLYQ